MRRSVLVTIIFAVLWIVACSSHIALPTVAMLPTVTPDPNATLTPLPTAFWLSQAPPATATNTVTPMHTPGGATLPPTWTPQPSATLWPTATMTFTPSLVPTMTPTASDTPVPSYQIPGVGAAVPPGVSGFEAQLWELPVLPTRISARVLAIFADGQVKGRSPNAFAKVGDCHTASNLFLSPFADGAYELGEYEHLETTIDYFDVVPPDSTADPFSRSSIAAVDSFSAASVLNSMWAPPSACNANESPLTCEIRRSNASVALILLGSMDYKAYDVDRFRTFYEDVVQTTIDQGVIPVLSTYPASPAYLWDQSLLFNEVIVAVAEREDLPLINFWRAARTLPNDGLRPDNFHLSRNGQRYVDLTGDEWQYGETLHNLLALQALDMLRVEVLDH